MPKSRRKKKNWEDEWLKGGQLNGKREAKERNKKKKEEVTEEEKERRKEAHRVKTREEAHKEWECPDCGKKINKQSGKNISRNVTPSPPHN